MRATFWALAPTLLIATQAIAQEPTQDGYDEAVAARHRGDPQRAIDLLAPVVAADPGNADAQVQFGYALLALGRLDEAERAFRSALAFAPSYVDASLGLARIEQRRGNRKAALRVLDGVPASNAEAAALRAQIEDDPSAARWSLDIDGSYSLVDGAQPDWRGGAVQLRHRASDRTTWIARIEAARRFGMTDVYGEVGIEQTLSDRARIYVTFGATPDADFRPHYQIAAGGSLGITDGGEATVLTFEARQAEYEGGEVQTISPGIEKYLANGRIWLTARWINLFDERGDHRAGYIIRADGQATERLRLFAGFGDAPDTAEGIVVDTRSYFGGASYDLDARTTLRLSLAHEDRETGSDRTQLGLGLGLRF